MNINSYVLYHFGYFLIHSIAFVLARYILDPTHNIFNAVSRVYSIQNKILLNVDKGKSNKDRTLKRLTDLIENHLKISWNEIFIKNCQLILFLLSSKWTKAIIVTVYEKNNSEYTTSIQCLFKFFRRLSCHFVNDLKFQKKNKSNGTWNKRYDNHTNWEWRRMMTNWMANNR